MAGIADTLPPRQEFTVTFAPGSRGRPYVYVQAGDYIVFQGETTSFGSIDELRAAIGRGIAANIRVPEASR